MQESKQEVAELVSLVKDGSKFTKYIKPENMYATTKT